LVVASGSIGFAQYVKYLVPLNFYQEKLVSVIVIICLVLLLYRRIETIGKLSVLLWIGVMITIVWIIAGGLTHKQIPYNFWPSDTDQFFKAAFWLALGQGSVKTIYSYLGYYNVCHLGGEILKPERNIPRSIFISITGIAILYLSMNISIAGVIPWQEAQQYSFIVSVFIERIYGIGAARIATALVLWVAFASLFAVLLGYSRVPYAAALDNNFFKPFAKLHPTKDFPYISLLYIAGLGIIFSLSFSLKGVISAILAMRILVQFIAQSIGVVLLRKRNKGKPLPFRMWFYPLPVITSILIWLFVFFSTGWFALWGVLISFAGVIAFYLKEYFEKKAILLRRIKEKSSTTPY
jgi:fructoselysine transporter